MRVSATAIFTLTTLAAGNVTQQATVAPAKTVTSTAKAGNLVMKNFTDFLLMVNSKTAKLRLEQFAGRLVNHRSDRF